MHKPSYIKKLPARSFRHDDRLIQIPTLENQPETYYLKQLLINYLHGTGSPNNHGWVKGRSVDTAVADIRSREGAMVKGDIEAFFQSIDQKRLKRQLDKIEPGLWPLVEPHLPDHGVPTGYPFSTVLGNLYLTPIDRRFPEMVRYADNFIVISQQRESVWGRLVRHLNDIGLSVHDVVFDPTTFCKKQIDPTLPPPRTPAFPPSLCPPPPGSIVRRPPPPRAA